MTQVQIPSKLVLKTTPKADWHSALTLLPVPAPQRRSPDKPGRQVGDILVSSGEVMVSVGPADQIQTRNIREAGKSAAAWLLKHHTAEIGLPVSALDDLKVDHALEAFCEGLSIGAFHFDLHKSKEEYSPISVHVLTEAGDTTTIEKIIRIDALASGVNLAREWSHEPPNVINPVTLAERALTLAAKTGLKCTVFDQDELNQMGASAILSVGFGSKTPSQMILLEHADRDKNVDSPPVVVVGKAITFDTGGYSLKNSQGMVGMKFDKCGGMAVLGIMQAVAALKLPTHVIGIVAAAENMISSSAYRPNDIITSLSGKTIEIISTDAEGRMVLSDALTYASTELKPRAIIDLATLTGGVVTALGQVRAGLMSTNDELADELMVAGDRCDERLWRLPLDEEYFELIKGSDSDLKNSAGKPVASAIVGGTFLKQFVLNDVPWAHIDIAGMATVENGLGGGQSATGFGVRLVVDYLENLS
jgi:leucyl aminopeptidase